jgi:hypothetical protein
LNTYGDLSLLEGETIFLDLVAYSSVVNDIFVFENVVDFMDLVTYSETINDVSFVSEENIIFDLVSYTQTVLDVLFIISVSSETPAVRRLLVGVENRQLLMTKEPRIVLIESEEE